VAEQCPLGVDFRRDYDRTGRPSASCCCRNRQRHKDGCCGSSEPSKLRLQPNVPHLFSFLVLCRKAACSVDARRNADRRMRMVQAAKLGHTLAVFASMIHVAPAGTFSMQGASTDEPGAVAMSGIFLGSFAKIARHGFSKSAAFGYAVAVGVSGNL